MQILKGGAIVAVVGLVAAGIGISGADNDQVEVEAVRIRTLHHLLKKETMILWLTRAAYLQLVPACCRTHQRTKAE